MSVQRALRGTIVALSVGGACVGSGGPSSTEPGAEGSSEPTPVVGDALHVGPAFSGSVLEGTTGGNRDASDLGEGCEGLVRAEGLDHTITLTHSQPLTLSVHAEGIGIVDLWGCGVTGADWSSCPPRCKGPGFTSSLVVA